MTKSKEKYRSDALHSAHSAMAGLYKVGAIDKETMREFNVECLETYEENEKLKAKYG